MTASLVNEKQVVGNLEPDVSSHYDEKYFDWQRDQGDFGGWANRMKFMPHIAPTDTVVDFGCGGGFLLKNINCAERCGVEINDTARGYAQRQNGIRAVKFVDELEDSFADVIISEHALEHCESPHQQIVNLRKKLKPGGYIVFVVPSESNRLKWAPGDINKHLFTWNPMTLGNLFTSAGYEVISVKALYQRWPPGFRYVAKLGWGVFNIASKVYGSLRRNTSEVKVVARKPAT